MECTFESYFAVDLIAHVEAAGHNEHPFIICPSCTEDITIKGIEKHYRQCVREVANGGKRRERKTKVQREKKVHQCATCGKILRDAGKLTLHMKMHMRAQGLTEEEAKTKLYHECDKCEKRFTQKCALREHIKEEHDGVVRKCPMCYLTFVKRSELFKHKNIAHSTDENIVCQYCGKRCASATARKNHELVHKEPEFQCRFCDKYLKTKEGVERHRKMHSGEKPFSCAVCSAQFTSRGGLGQHMRGAHGIAPGGGKPGWHRKKKST